MKILSSGFEKFHLNKSDKSGIYIVVRLGDWVFKDLSKILKGGEVKSPIASQAKLV
jgi:hypothetical protein